MKYQGLIEKTLLILEAGLLDTYWEHDREIISLNYKKVTAVAN